MTPGRRSFGTNVFVGLKLRETKNSILEPVVGLLFFDKEKDLKQLLCDRFYLS